MPNSRRLILLATLLFGFILNAYASTADDWEAGQQSFQQGDFASALVSFQSAKRSGLGGPAIHYNIAVCHFKLDDFEQADQEFRYVADQFPAMRGLAEYNLGLVARRLDDSGAARRHFLRAYELSPEDRKLRVLSSRQLRDLEPDVSSSSPWTGVLGVRVGNDDNAALRDELGLPSGITAASPMVDVFGSVRSPWTGRSGFRLDGSAYLIQYLDADEFDQTDVRGRIFYEWNLSDWRFEFGVHAGAGSLGGDAFDQKAGANGRAVFYPGRNNSVDLRYSYDEISDADPLYAGINGSRQQFDARYRWYSDGHRLLLRYLSETNDRDDPGVSPSRSRIGIDYRYQPEDGWGYEAGIYSRTSDYDDLVTPREEELLTIRAGLTHALPTDWLVILDYRYSENDSSDPTFSYDRNQVTLGIMKIF